MYNFIYGMFFVYIILLKFKFNIGILKFLRRSGYNLAFMIIWNIYITFVKKNVFELEIKYIVIITNIWLAISKTLIKYNFLYKLKFKIEKLEDVRLQLMIIFILDSSVGLKVIMSNKSINQELILAYFNILVMNIYNMT
jgi:hypothetical protein